ncbi:Hsp20/alpha crystallin family protein [Pedobacter faecalis]|uniref:Hsp20/alpha crystallin family protein n=1 Tax=Pedobacter faecalis TaxID=3041495 RepID=UPI00254C308E|nr:Hsp20/alpha crystallin family protein [Pedobacter sp. ELA7]
MTLVKFNNRTRNTAPYFNNVFDSLFSEAINKNLTVNKVPGVNILEDEQGYKIELAAPGIGKEDFQINLVKNTLTISSDKKQGETEEKKNFTRKEFEYTSFSRSFVLPESVNTDSIEAHYQDGILRISIGKENSQSQVRDIKVS